MRGDAVQQAEMFVPMTPDQFVPAYVAPRCDPACQEIAAWVAFHPGQCWGGCPEAPVAAAPAAVDPGVALLAAAGLTSPARVQQALAAAASLSTAPAATALPTSEACAANCTSSSDSESGCEFWSVCGVEHVRHAVVHTTVAVASRAGGSLTTAVGIVDGSCSYAVVEMISGGVDIIIATPADEAGGEVVQYLAAIQAFQGYQAYQRNCRYG